MKLPSACSGFELDALADVLLTAWLPVLLVDAAVADAPVVIAAVADAADAVPDMPDWESAWKMAETNVPTSLEPLLPTTALPPLAVVLAGAA